MGNANTHERRKSGAGVPETGLTIENIREKPRVEEAALVSTDTMIIKQADKTPPPSFETQSSGTEKKPEEEVDSAGDPEFRPRAGTVDTDTGARLVKQITGAVSQGKGLPTIFKISGDKAKEAYVCGTFSNWEKIPMVRTQKDFFALVDLPVGEHQFKYFVDNEWTNDKNLPTVDNDQGSRNNVISIQQEDFEAFAALDMDSAATNVRHHRGGEVEFGQDIPGLSTFESKPGPPILPPHLLQVSGEHWDLRI